jgi:hypothetical protein
MILAYILLGGSSLFMIYQDIREQTIPLYGLIVFAGVSLLFQVGAPNPDGFWAFGTIALIFSALQGTFYLITRQTALGWGDLILSPFCGLWLYHSEIPLYLLSTGILALLTGIFWRYRWGIRPFPMAPAILLGMGAVVLIRCFLMMNEL